MVYGKTIKETLESARCYKTLIHLAAVAGVDLDVSNCTVFAPTDDTFRNLRAGYVDELLADPATARAVVLRHILPGRVFTSRQISGCGFWDGVPGGPLGYEGLGPIVKVGGAQIIMQIADNECDNGTIHAVNRLITTPHIKTAGVSKYYQPSIPAFGESIVSAQYPTPKITPTQRRAVGACLPSTVGGRKAMGLISQLPFWQYGPPFNAAKQEDFEPISIAFPECGAGVDYQLMPPGSVIVIPDEVSAAKLLPVSGMSKYIGQTKRLVGGDALSTYSDLDN